MDVVTFATNILSARLVTEGVTNASVASLYDDYDLTAIRTQQYFSIGFSCSVASVALYVIIVLSIYRYRHRLCSCDKGMSTFFTLLQKVTLHSIYYSVTNLLNPLPCQEWKIWIAVIDYVKLKILLYQFVLPTTKNVNEKYNFVKRLHLSKNLQYPKLLLRQKNHKMEATLISTTTTTSFPLLPGRLKTSTLPCIRKSCFPSMLPICLAAIAIQW